MRAWMAERGFTAPDYNNGEKLIDATAAEDIPAMMRLLKAGTDVNYRGESSWTPVLFAAAWNRYDSVKLLLEHGADPNAVHIPCSHYTGVNLSNNPKIASLFLAAQGKGKAVDNTATIDYSLGQGRTDMVEWFLNHGTDAKHVDEQGRTYLFEARNPEIAELLIKHGVDVKAKAKDGMTALHEVVLYGDKTAEVARVLLEHGADPNARSNTGLTPLMWAHDGPTVDVLVKYGADIHAQLNGQSMITMQGMLPSSSRIEALIRHGASFDPKTDGPTLLMLSAWRNNVDVMSFLLNRGIDPNLKGCWNKQYNDYMTALTAAVTSGQYDAAKILVEHGARIQEPDENGKKGMNNMINALHNRRTSIVKLFWDHGDRSISELCYQVTQGAPIEELQKILASGVPADPPQDKSITPLGEACVYGNMDAVKLLVDHGADVNAKGTLNPQHPEYTISPLYMAAIEGQDGIVQYLLEHAAKFDFNALSESVWNCNPYPNQRSKDHFEKTIKLLIDAGGLKGLSEEAQVNLLMRAIFSRYPRRQPERH